MVKKVEVGHLKTGMYICQLDCSWLKTPFFSHKFLIKNSNQLEQLKQYCTYVYIDTLKGVDVQRETPASEEEVVFQDEILLEENEIPSIYINTKIGTDVQRDLPASGKVVAFQGEVLEKKINTEEKEKPSPPDMGQIKRSAEVYDHVKNITANLLENVRVGRSIQTEDAEQMVESMVNSLVEDQNALLCLTKLKSQDEYTVTHSISVSIISMAFGRGLGLGQNELRLLGLGSLMHDIGKMKVPLEILNKPGKLTDSEFEIIKKHVLFSEEVLRETEDFPSTAIPMVREHHEKFNGKGYLSGLEGDRISLFGKMVAIVDVYDAITTDRVYREAMAPHTAMKRMYEWSKTDFDQKLVEKFIKILGIYPVGSLVEINHSDIGLIVSNNPDNTLKPCVLVLYDNRKTKHQPPWLINLMDKDADSDKDLWSITKIINPIDKEMLIDF